jgi:prepilin signal peptidase PulO-like enzyme (type II secretory pathway)
MIVAMKILIWVVAAGAASALASYFLVVRERGWAGSTDGSSRCICGKPLYGYELIPVLSWLLLGGKSNCCKVRLPVTYFIVELITASFGGVGIYHHVLWYLLPLIYVAILFLPTSLFKTTLPKGFTHYVPSEKSKAKTRIAKEKVASSQFSDDEE